MLPPHTFTISRPLLNLTTVAAITELSSTAILAAIDAGEIEMAFDIATPGAHRKCLRIAAPSVKTYLAGDTARRMQPLNVQSEVEKFFPALAVTLQSATLARIFDCDTDLLIELGRCKCLTITNAPRRGIGGSALFDRKSAIAFLVGRRVQ